MCEKELVGLDLESHFVGCEQHFICRIMKVLSRQELKKAEEKLRNYFPWSREVCRSHLILISEEYSVLILGVHYHAKLVVSLHYSVFYYVSEKGVFWKKAAFKKERIYWK